MLHTSLLISPLKSYVLLTLTLKTCLSWIQNVCSKQFYSFFLYPSPVLIEVVLYIIIGTILNVCVFLNSYVENPLPKVMIGSRAFGKWLGHEGGVSMIEVSALTRALTEMFYFPPSCGDKQNSANCDHESSLSSGTEPASILILALPAPRTIRNLFLLLISHPICGILLM